MLLLHAQSKDALIEKANSQIHNEPDKAIESFKKLLSTEKDSKKKIKYYLLMSSAYISKRDLDQSFKAMKSAQELSNEIDDNKTKASVLINVAIQYQQMELYSNSFENLENAEKLSVKLSDTAMAKYSMLGIIYTVRGTIYRIQSSPELALQKFQTGIDYFNKLKKSYSTEANLSIIYYNIGYCYLEMKNYAKAEISFDKSLQLARDNKATSLEAFAYKALGELYFYDKDYKKSLVYLDKAEEKANNIGDIILDQGIYLLKSNNYLALRETDLYRNYYKKYQNIVAKKQQNEFGIISKSIDDVRETNQLALDEVLKSYKILNLIVVVVSLLIIGFVSFFLYKQLKLNRSLSSEINEKFSHRKLS